MRKERRRKRKGKRRAYARLYVSRGNFPEQIGGNRNARVRSLKEKKKKKKKERKEKRNRCPDRNSSSERQVIENPRDAERYSFSLSLSLSLSLSRFLIFSLLSRSLRNVDRKERKKKK